jgi:hypothetical protein
MVARWLSVCGLLFAAVPAVAGSTILVVPAPPWDSTLRDSGVGVRGVEIVSAQATQGLIDDARSVGLTCPPEDAACWLRVAVLGGYDQALLLVDDRLVLVSPTATTTTAIDRRDAAAFTGALRRLVGLEGAVQVVVDPDQDAVRSLDGIAIGAGIVDGVTPGLHHVVVDAPGFARAETDVDVSAGAIATVTITLTPSTSPPLAMGPLVWWTGVGTLALGGVGAAALIVAGESRYAADGCGSDNNLGSVCGQGGTAAKAAQSLTLGGLGVGAAAVVVGGAALVMGAVLTE